MKRKYAVWGVLVLTGLVAGISVIARAAGQGGTNYLYLPAVQNDLPPIIPNTTKVLSEATTQHLASISSDGTVYTFNQTTPELDSLTVGDVIVSDVSANAPNGFLRKVLSVSNSGGQVLVTTEQATLEDAIQQGELHVSQTLSPTDVMGGIAAEGVTLKETPEGEFFIELNDAVLYDDDGDPGTTGDQIRADGSITLDPSYEFDFVVHDWQLRELLFTSSVEQTSELEITAYLFEVGLDKEKVLATYPFTPIVFWVGWLPVVIQPQLDVVVGVDGSVHAGLATSVTQQATLTAGVTYEDGTWGTISDFDNDFTYSPPTLTAGVTVKGYGGARLTLKLYGVVGPYAMIDLYLELEADLFADPWWVLYGGLEVPVGVRVEILGHELADWEGPAIGYKVILAQADGTPGSGTTTRVSVASDGTQANGDSDDLSISADGRYVAFRSWADNLVSGDTNSADDIFVHDRQTGQTSRVSVASDGTQANGDSDDLSISADGRYVAFRSWADNLVSGDTNGEFDVFVHDRQTGQTSRVSVASDGTQGNSHSWAPSVSADGRYVAFNSWANNLVSGDSNGRVDIFVHDRQTGQTNRVSVASDGTQANGDSVWPSISADGRYVAFHAWANNLVSGDTNGWYDIFVHDRQTGQTSRVSVASDGTQGNDDSWSPSISADGHYVAFRSRANNLVSGDTNGRYDVFVHDRGSP
jgi:Tol biopolymer transport system component